MRVITKNQGTRRFGLRAGLMVAGALAMGLTVQGCGGGGGGGSCPPAAISVSWGITAGGAAISCTQAGAFEVVVSVDGSTVNFPCMDLGGMTPPIAAGTHSVSATLVDTSNHVLDMVGPMTVTVNCNENAVLQPIPFAVTPVCADATLSASWTLTANGAPVSCAQAGATEVDFIIDTMEVPFQCTALQGTTPTFAAGTHSVSFELRDAAMNVLSKLAPMSETFQCGEDRNMGSIEFSLTP